MKKSIAIAIMLFLTVPLLADEGVQKSLSVTVYNQNLGVVKDIRTFDLLKGITELQIRGVAEQIQPATVHLSIKGSVIEQNFRYDLANFGKVLDKYIDKEIILQNDKAFYKGILLSSGNSKNMYSGISAYQLILKKDDGGLLMLPKIDDYQISVTSLPEELITQPTLAITINTEASGKQEVELSYQTKGMSWSAEYVAVLNENDTKMDLNAWVSIINQCGATFKNANLKLVAGNINIIDRRKYNYDESQVMGYMVPPVPALRQFEEKSFFEYHLYDLQRPTTLNDNETKQISLFETKNIELKKKYILYCKPDNSQSSNNFEDNFESIPQNKVQVVCEFLNKKENNLGVPMPKGVIGLYKSDGKSLEFIGEDKIDHTPKDEKVKLKIGEAFDIKAEEKLTEEKKITNKSTQKTFEVTFKNRKDDDVTVQLEKKIYSEWTILDSSQKYEKKDANTLIINVDIPKNSEVNVEFTMRLVY